MLDRNPECVCRLNPELFHLEKFTGNDVIRYRKYGNANQKFKSVWDCHCYWWIFYLGYSIYCNDYIPSQTEIKNYNAKNLKEQLLMKLHSRLHKLFFFIIGIGASIWFLIRVIPKPSRATYPCMRAAYPIASAFVVYLLGLATSAFALGKMRDHWKKSRYWAMAGFFVIALIAGFLSFQADQPTVYANTNSLDTAHAPIGVGKGIFPGRVVWIHNPAAVNQAYTNSTDDYWLQDNNTYQTAVNGMISKAIQTLTGKGSDAESWDAIFRYYNQNHNRGNVGYTAGEKIVIKLNLNNAPTGDNYSRDNLRTVDTSPQVAYAILNQLVHITGVAQADISIGDPGRNIDDTYWNKLYPDFLDVKYWGSGNGRTPIVQSDNPELMTSDGMMQIYLPACYVEATYIINIPVFKQHHRAGISLSSKNHFGSILPWLNMETLLLFIIVYLVPREWGLLITEDIENIGFL